VETDLAAAIDRLLVPGGFAILQFLVDSDLSARRKMVSETINQWLIRLPGSNRPYQPGDTCPQGHFLHAFQSEQELREELSESDIVLRDLNWQRQYLVIAAPLAKSSK
jgi:hypothetical protein